MAILELTAETGENGTVRLILVGELDISSAPQLEEALTRAEEGAAPVIVVDLRELAVHGLDRPADRGDGRRARA